MRVVLYKDPSSRVEWEILETFLSDEGFSISLREDLFLSKMVGVQNFELLLARKIAEIRVMGITEKDSLNPEPFPVEIDYEKRNLGREDRKMGPVYSGYHFQSFLREILLEREDHFSKTNYPPKSEVYSSKSEVHIHFTNQRLATWGEDRWHLRTILLGLPTVISTTGLVEAPAREREYYLLKSLDPGLGEKWLKENPNHLEHDDPRLTEVVKGYLWQAVFYGFSLCRGVQLNAQGDFSFCENPECSLYNSHWQREVLSAQFGGKLCKNHRELKNRGLACP